MNYHRNCLLLCTALVASSGVSQGADAAMEEPETPLVSGSLTLAVNTHFISYGHDIWATGDSWSDPLFNPSLELSFDLGGGFSAILGTWWDVNDNAPSSIGNAIQEVDVWTGIAYTRGKWNFALVYQEWLYASQSERIVDFKVGYDHWLNPSVMFHGRVDIGEQLGLDEGLVTVLGIAPGKEFESFSLSFPLNVAFDTDNYHGGDAGFSFVSLGIGADVPLTFMRGDWTFKAGVTGYHTNDDVIAVNADSEFITGTAGISLAF